MPWIKNWFSNMLPLDTPFEYQGILFSTVENFYVAMKTQKHEVELRKQIAAMPPHVAKRFGRQLQRRPDWEDIKLPVMEFALRIKFAPGTNWHKKLIATGDTEIVEYNNWVDKFWGPRGFNGLAAVVKLDFNEPLFWSWRRVLMTTSAVDEVGSTFNNR